MQAASRPPASGGTEDKDDAHISHDRHCRARSGRRRPVKVSVLILTRDEERNLPRCLKALEWCDDILVLDSGSTDRTCAIAEASGARVMHRPFDSFAGQRNFGLEQGGMRHEWVLHLDADEEVTPGFRAALEEMQPEIGIDAYQVPSKMMLFGRWLQHAGQYPTYQVRLGHRDRLRFRQVGHGQREDTPAERVAVFPEPYLHYSFSHGMRHWLLRHVRYAEDEARLLSTPGGTPRDDRTGRTGRRRALKAASGRLPLWSRPFLRFFYVYLLRGGFRDGIAGLAYATMMATYEGMIAVFAYEARLGSEGDAGEWPPEANRAPAAPSAGPRQEAITLPRSARR